MTSTPPEPGPGEQPGPASATGETWPVSLAKTPPPPPFVTPQAPPSPPAPQTPMPPYPYGAAPSTYGSPYSSPPPPPTAPYGAMPPYGGVPGYGWAPPRPSRTMAIWALVLCCIFFFPIAVLVGIGLAIAVLARSKPGLDYGRTQAIVGLVIGGFVLLGWVGLILLGAFPPPDSTSEPDASAHPAGTHAVRWDQLRVGQCFDQDDKPAVGQSKEVSTLDVIDCGSPHEYEVYARFSLTDASYPGEKAARDEASQGCVDRYKSFEGVPASDSSMYYLSFYPLPSTWKAGHTEATCALGPGDRKVTGTLRGAKR